ncbi:MAG: hypothetical protein N4J56_001251 [Chroococcidiopsis sp. SAG 2025]|uniref:hypothetical protein n=1 Tax=Chroococcidiopsis sp. SAG 2025 TaxID=171389 RepID=UPI0029371823|nr:hypothetical protein [Chroococcidiopsis sp. SAG 2025]MDV2991597.1 hypothetical protein [Chroococcidiopsis sp. SAG 2025]
MSVTAAKCLVIPTIPASNVNYVFTRIAYLLTQWQKSAYISFMPLGDRGRTSASVVLQQVKNNQLHILY